MTFSVQTSPEGHHQPHLACPECGVHSVVQHGSIYACLSCNFRRNVSESAKSNKSNESMGTTAVLIIVVAILALLVTVPSSPLTNGMLTPNTPRINHAW